MGKLKMEEGKFNSALKRFSSLDAKKITSSTVEYTIHQSRVLIDAFYRKGNTVLTKIKERIMFYSKKSIPRSDRILFGSRKNWKPISGDDESGGFRSSFFI